MSDYRGWELMCRLFASGDRKVEYLYVTEDLPSPEQVSTAYEKLVYLFAAAREEPTDKDAQVHRVELLITPEPEGGRP